MKKIIGIVLLLGLSACQPPPPLSYHEMLPQNSVYDNNPKRPFLKNKIRLGDLSTNIETDKTDYGIDHLVSNYPFAVEASLKEAELLSREQDNAQYVLNGDLVHVKTMMFGFTEWESGASANYELIDSKTKAVVYKETIVVPYTQEKPIFMSDAQKLMVYRQTIAGAVASNIAHLVQKLARLDKGDLK